MKILVIEDQPSESKLADHVLSSAGNNVTAVGNAEVAAELIHSDRPEIILLDMALPGMDGLALVRLLKSDPATSDILIVAVTSYPERYPKAKLLAAGCDAYLVKPLSTRTLPQSLMDVVNSK